MMNMNPELMKKAKAAKSAEELLALAKESGMELTKEDAAAYFTRLHEKKKELSEEELDNVSGGCGSDDSNPAKPSNQLIIGSVIEREECCPKCLETQHKITAIQKRPGYDNCMVISFQCINCNHESAIYVF
ncbi:MAG: Nif11-like leader peptide family RiPP precursor [Roseburia sp.]